MTAAALIADASAAITRLLAQSRHSLAQRIWLSFHVRHSVSHPWGLVSANLIAVWFATADPLILCPSAISERTGGLLSDTV